MDRDYRQYVIDNYCEYMCSYGINCVGYANDNGAVIYWGNICYRIDDDKINEISNTALDEYANIDIM